MRSLFPSGFRRAAGLGLLAFAGLAVPAVHAQTLSIEEGTATISGSGTVVTGYYTMFGGGASAATSSYSSVYSDFTGTLTLQPGGSIQTLTSSGGKVTMNGGTVGTFSAAANYVGDGEFYNPTVSVTGGSVNTMVSSGGYAYQPFGGYAAYDTVCNLSGGTFGTLDATNYGGYDVFGTNLNFSKSGLITGILSSGQAINAQYVNTDAHGFLEFNGVAVPAAAVPEASTTVSLGLLLTLGFGSLVLAKRRAKTAASSV